jgi:hypothetical protein
VLSLVLAALSAAVLPPTPSYDPQAWLLWGREAPAGELNLREGPAFKPLPVAVCALLAPLGDAAPAAWVVLARAAALLALVLAFQLGRRLAGGDVLGGLLAAALVAACEGFVALAGAGMSEGLLLALGLGAAQAAWSGRPRAALAFAAGAALVRVETWPFLLLAAVPAWRRRRLRPALLALPPLVAAAWLVPELFGSGDVLRSGSRARQPAVGAAADASWPEALGDAAAILPWPAWAGLAVLAAWAWRRRGREWTAALAPFAAGLAWVALVAAMAAAGFSGEARYSLPGVALLALGGGVGLAALTRALRPAARAALVAGALALALAPRLGELPELQAGQAHAARLDADLGAAIAAAGGAERLLACGTPYVGPLRGPLAAYHLRVAKERVEPDLRPRAPGVVLRSPLAPGAPIVPAVPAGFRRVARAGVWDILASCRVR